MATTDVNCWYCNKPFLVAVKEVNRGNGKFCSLSCAAAYGNRLRKKAKVPNRKCSHCDKAFYRKDSLVKTEKVYCSKKCFYKGTHPLYSKATLTMIIKGFYKENDRIPLHEEFNSNPKYPNPETYKVAFGSWNKAIEAAGFDSNSSSLGRICIARDGHKCRSFAEKIIDDWLFQRSIEHKKEAYYPNCNLRTDWRIGDVFVEYIGISLDHRNRLSDCYQRTLVNKRNICLRLGLRLIELYPQDLSNLENKFTRCNKILDERDKR